MTTLSFKANILNSYRNEDGIFIIGFAEDDSFEEYLTIQFQEELTEQDVELKWTHYYLELGRTGSGGYDTISEIELNDDNIVFILNSKGINIFNYNKILINFTFDANKLKSIKDTLINYFSNEPEVKLNIFFN
jgi:hypothetical protein